MTRPMHRVIRKQQNLLLLAAALVGQLLLLTVQVAAPSPDDSGPLIRQWAVALFLPIENFTLQMKEGVQNAWARYLHLREVQAENERLKGENNRLVMENARLQTEAAHSARLQALLELKGGIPYQSIAARVIGASTHESFKTITLNKGGRDHLTLNSAVICREGLVGRIVQVGKRSALVQLLSDSESGLGVLFEKSRVHGVLKGTGGLEQAVDYVLNEETIEVGDVVRTSGEDGIYPKDLLVGYVTAVQSGKNIFKQISVRPAARLNRLEEVLVLVPSPTRESP